MTNSTIEALKIKQAQIAARIQSLQAKETKQQRKDETRKKILAGSYSLEKHTREGTMEEFKNELNLFLTRNNDRILFGLPKISDEKQN